ncbi:MAG: hypothetical protein NC402_01160 [Prevotella sp.]|nr:hypothetical protein [Prevotella sp.]MCM1075457.1 hypothetical protein [Ruminococcus sp.]
MKRVIKMMSKKKQEKNKASVLAYRSEEDRSYGLAGMTLALATLDAIDNVVRVNMDSEGPMVIFSNEFFWGSSQAASAKAHWHTLMRNFQITASLALANVLSRCLIRERGADPTSMLDALLPVIVAEGMEICSLEEDEVHRFYENALMQSRRTFGNPRLHPYVDRLAGVLAEKRTLSGREIAEELHALHII